MAAAQERDRAALLPRAGWLLPSLRQGVQPHLLAAVRAAQGRRAVRVERRAASRRCKSCSAPSPPRPCSSRPTTACRSLCTPTRRATPPARRSCRTKAKACSPSPTSHTRCCPQSATTPCTSKKNSRSSRRSRSGGITCTDSRSSCTPITARSPISSPSRTCRSGSCGGWSFSREFDFKIEYVKGEQNVVADALSRRADHVGVEQGGGRCGVERDQPAARRDQGRVRC